MDWRLIYRAKVSGQLSKYVLTRLRKTNPLAPENSRGQTLFVRTKELLLDGKSLGDYFGISRNTMNKYIRGFANKTKPPLVSQREIFDFLDKVEYLSMKYRRHPKKIVENAKRLKSI